MASDSVAVLQSSSGYREAGRISRPLTRPHVDAGSREPRPQQPHRSRSPRSPEDGPSAPCPKMRDATLSHLRAGRRIQQLRLGVQLPEAEAGARACPRLRRQHHCRGWSVRKLLRKGDQVTTNSVMRLPGRQAGGARPSRTSRRAGPTRWSGSGRKARRSPQESRTSAGDAGRSMESHRARTRTARRWMFWSACGTSICQERRVSLQPGAHRDRRSSISFDPGT